MTQSEASRCKQHVDHDHFTMARQLNGSLLLFHTQTRCFLSNERRNKELDGSSKQADSSKLGTGPDITCSAYADAVVHGIMGCHESKPSLHSESPYRFIQPASRWKRRRSARFLSAGQKLRLEIGFRYDIRPPRRALYTESGANNSGAALAAR